MAKVQEIGPYSAYAIAVKYGYQGTEEEWAQEQEANRKAAEAAAAAAEQSAKNAAASASGAAQSGQQAVQNIKDAQTSAEQAIDTAKQQAVQAAQAEAVKASASAGQAASSAAEAAQSATNAAAEVGKVQSAGTTAVQAVQAAQNTATGAVSAAQQSATQAVSQAQTAAVSAVQETGTTQKSAVESAGTAAVSAVSNAKTEALTQVSTAGTAQVSAVETAGADAVEDVNDAKTAALEEIEDANAALPNPTQSDAGKVPVVNAEGTGYELGDPQVDAYSKSESDARYAPIAAAIRPTASGNPVSITDSVEWPLQGLKVYGKSTQDGIPSPENPVPIVSAGDGGQVEVTVCGANFFDSSLIPTETRNGVSCTVLDDGSISLNGTPTATAVFSVEVEAENYVRLPQTFLTASINEAAGRNVYALFRLRKGGKVVADFATYNSETVDISGIDYDSIQIGIQASLGSSVNGNFKIMVNVGQNSAPWSPYSGFQSLTISTPNGLPGIPVGSGGNYADTSGQQLVCNYKDYERGVYVQRVKLFEMTSELSIASMAGFNTGTFNGGYWPFRVYTWQGEIIKNSIAMCNNFQFGDSWGVKAERFYTVETTIDFNIEFSRIGVTSESNDQDAENKLKQWLSENPMFCLCQLITPIETPLSEEELAAYRALHTYDGTTVVSTAEDVAGLEVKYVADAQKYIDNRLTAAESHIQEIAAAQLNAQTGG